MLGGFGGAGFAKGGQRIGEADGRGSPSAIRQEW